MIDIIFKLNPYMLTSNNYDLLSKMNSNEPKEDILPSKKISCLPLLAIEISRRMEGIFVFLFDSLHVFFMELQSRPELCIY